MHYTGAHPFKVLTCDSCNHILCGEDCLTTAIMTPVKSVVMEVFHERASSSTTPEVPYCRVCRNCGLSHRATRSNGLQYSMLDFAPILCSCGRLAHVDKASYHIGSVHEYRQDPERYAVELRLERLHAKSDKLMKGQG